MDAELLELEQGENFALFARNRRTRGGGVAVAYDINKAKLKEFKLPGNKYEMVCTVGNLSAGGNRKIAAISLYIPHRSNVQPPLQKCVIVWQTE